MFSTLTDLFKKDKNKRIVILEELMDRLTDSKAYTINYRGKGHVTVNEKRGIFPNQYKYSVNFGNHMDYDQPYQTVVKNRKESTYTLFIFNADNSTAFIEPSNFEMIGLDYYDDNDNSIICINWLWCKY